MRNKILLSIAWASTIAVGALQNTVNGTWAFPAAQTYLRPVAQSRAESERDDREEIDCDTDGTNSHQADNWAWNNVPATHFD